MDFWYELAIRELARLAGDTTALRREDVLPDDLEKVSRLPRAEPAEHEDE